MIAAMPRRIDGRPTGHGNLDNASGFGQTNRPAPIAPLRRGDRAGHDDAMGPHREPGPAERGGRFGPRASDGLCCATVFDPLSAFIEDRVLHRRQALEDRTTFQDTSRAGVRNRLRGTRAA
jgi:hypothetical protein